MAEETVIQAEVPKVTEPQATIWATPQHTLDGFLDFIRERGVATFAVGFILGGAAQTMVQAFMTDIVNPFIGLFLGSVNNLSAYTIDGFKVGDFASVLINFVILCFVMYLIFRVLHLEKLDKPKK